jgi:molybdopterin molybdotransferase
MTSVAEAERLVRTSVGRLPAERCKIQMAAGRVLRQAITADRDGPPFDRATLDGVCIRASEWAAGRREWQVAGLQAAGSPPLAAPPEGACLEIMTGAPLPAPCDAVLPVEDFTREGDVVRANAGASLAAGQGVHLRGSDFRTGAELLAGGVRLTGREIAVAASCGAAFVEVTIEPKIAILTTGDELVDVDEIPKLHQIRRSNDLALKATIAAAAPAAKIELNHLPDNPQAISWNLERLLQQADVIVVTGGVSKGRFDFLPGALKDLGVAEHFHGVAQRPGRPMFFGTSSRAGDFLHPEDTRVVAVFALPGNPVSSFACVHRYVLPALALMQGGAKPRLPECAFLEKPVARHAKLTLFVPVVLAVGADGRLRAMPRPFNTSGDFASVATTDGFVEIEPGTGDVAAETAVPLWRWS